MSDRVIKELDEYSTFTYNKSDNRITNLKSNNDANVDEFFEIQFLVDKNRLKSLFFSFLSTLWWVFKKYK